MSTHDENYTRRFLETGEVRCYHCDKLIHDPINQFGDTDKPFCMRCFLDPNAIRINKDHLYDIRKRINEIEDQIGELECEKDQLEDELSELIKGNMKTKKQEIDAFIKWYEQSTGEKYQNPARLANVR